MDHQVTDQVNRQDRRDQEVLLVRQAAAGDLGFTHRTMVHFHPLHLSGRLTHLLLPTTTTRITSMLMTKLGVDNHPRIGAVAVAVVAEAVGDLGGRTREL